MRLLVFSLLVLLSSAVYAQNSTAPQKNVEASQTADEKAEAIKSVETLPSDIIESQKNLVKMTTCQADWTDVAMDFGIKNVDLDENTKMYVVPCAHWAVNYGVAIYVTVKERSNPQGYVTLLQQFGTYKYGSMTGSPLVHNVQWDPMNKTILSVYYNNQNGGCGVAAGYQWNQGAQMFKQVRMKIYDDCRAPKDIKDWDDVVFSLVRTQSPGAADSATTPNNGARDY